MVYNRFARWCAEKGYKIEIFTPGDGKTQQIENVKIHSIEMLAPFRYYRDLYFDLLPIRPRLYDYFEQNPFDLIHIVSQGHMGFLALLVAAKAKLPKISCYHTAVPEYAESRALKFFGDNAFGRTLGKIGFDLTWWFQRKLFLSSSMILVPTKSIMEMVDRELGIPTGYFTRGVDSEAYSPKKRKARNEDRPVTLYAGRISIEKNLKLLERLELTNGDGLQFVGDGPYTDTLRENLPAARFDGFLTGEDLQNAYANADVFVFPSKTDTFGNAVLEAMSSGLPVVVTDVLGPKDFVKHEETGFIAGSDEEFVRYHRMLVDDADLRKRMGRNAREYAKSCNWDSIFENQVIGNYRKVIEEERG